MKASELKEKALEWYYAEHKEKPKLSLIQKTDIEHIEMLYMLNRIMENK